MKTIGIIGFGNMGCAFAAGLLKKGYTVLISELKEERIRLAKEQYNLVNYADKNELIKKSDIIVLAVKPQELQDLFREIKESMRDKNIISIIAGRRISRISEGLNTANVCRFMPNLAAACGVSFTGVAFNEGLGGEFKTACLDIACSVGAVYEVPEKLISAVTGLSGSGIAFAFAFIHALALGGVSAGIPYDRALEGALATAEGAVSILRNSRDNPVTWLSRVISPAGTTIKGVEALEEKGFNNAVIKAVTESAKRAEELEN